MSNKVAGFFSLPKLEPKLALLGKWNLNKNEKVLINHILFFYSKDLFLITEVTDIRFISWPC